MFFKLIKGNFGGTLRPSGSRERFRGEARLQRVEPEEDLDRSHERDQGRHPQDDSANFQPRRRRSQPGVLLQADGEHEQRSDILRNELKCDWNRRFPGNTTMQDVPQAFEMSTFGKCKLKKIEELGSWLSMLSNFTF